TASFSTPSSESRARSRTARLAGGSLAEGSLVARWEHLSPPPRAGEVGEGPSVDGVPSAPTSDDWAGGIEAEEDATGRLPASVLHLHVLSGRVHVAPATLER